MEVVNQIAIMLLGTSTVFLVGSKAQHIRRWGYITGLASEPFWLWSAITHDQWGVAVMVAVYTFGWARGALNHFKGL